MYEVKTEYFVKHLFDTLNSPPQDNNYVLGTDRKSENLMKILYFNILPSVTFS